jgi:hypothetical protein
MSLSILQQPTYLFNSAGNDNFYTVSGTTYLAPNTADYQFVANVYVNGSTLPACTLASFPDPIYGFGVFNIKKIVSELLSFDFFGDTYGPFHQCLNSSLSIQIQFGEQYTSGSTFVQSSTLATSNTIYCINAARSFLDNLTDPITNYIPAVSGSTFYYLIGLNRDVVTYNAYTDLNSWIYFINHANISKAVITTYNANDAQVGQYSVSNPYNTYTGILAFDTGYPQLSSLTSEQFTVISGPSSIFGTSVTSYSVQLTGSGITSAAEYYDIENDCGRYAPDAYQVFFLNSLGGFDSWLFNKKNETTSKKTQANYKKTQGTLNANGTYTVQTSDPSTISYYTMLQDSIAFTTDFLDDQQVIFLKDMFSSPAVYIQQVGGPLIAANIVPDSYKLNKIVNKKIYSLSLTVEPQYNDYRQNR